MKLRVESAMVGCEDANSHQQPEVNYLPRFSPQLVSPVMYTLSVYIAGEIDLLENLDTVHITLLVERSILSGRDRLQLTELIRNTTHGGE